MKAEEVKRRAIEELRRRVEEQREQLAGIEWRLLEYYDGLCEHVGTEKGDPNDWHNVYELLGGIRLLRLLRTYEVDYDRVRQAIRDGEGEWRREGNRWRHVRGGVRQPGRQHPVVYRWEPFQVFALVSIYGLRAWIDTENAVGTRDLLETERENEATGHIEDLRRLCTRFILFGPRKINKSGFGAFINTEDFMRGDYDAQIFCTANSQDQSKILFKKTQDMLRSFDPDEKRIRFTATETNWKEGQFRAAQMKALPAGGKMPDGWFASTVDADEYGSASYVNGKSDMGATVATAESSMGPRREPLTVITTTASLVSSGPFLEMLDSTHKMLMREIPITGYLSPAAAEPPHTEKDSEDRWDDGWSLAEDRQMCLLLEPDAWERDEEYLLTSKALRRKVNPMLGKIAQHSFYDDEVAKSRMDATKRRETIAKLFNVYVSGQVKPWAVSSDRVRSLQCEMRVTDCKYSDGWSVFVGMDFSSGEDLFALSYFCVNYSPGLEMKDRFFADCEAWIVENELFKSPNRPLYEKWVEQGWLQVCPGEVFDADYAINRLMEKNEVGVNLRMFGFDPAQSKQPINTLKAWLQSLGMDGDTIKSMVVPVSQSFLTMNPIIGELEHYILTPWLRFSSSPLWPWMAGNVQVVTSRDETLRRLHKSGVNNKIDCLHALLDAIYVFDMSEGRE